MLSILSGCSKEKEVDTRLDGDAIVEVKYLNDIHSVGNMSDGRLAYYLNGNFMKYIDSKYQTDGFIDLEKTDGMHDLAGLEMITNNVYEADIDIASRYVNHLKNQGYTELYKANTSKFIELFLQKDGDDLYKRLIITNNYIVVSDVSQIPKVVIENYLYKNSGGS